MEFGRKASKKVREDIVARFKIDNIMMKNFSVLDVHSIKEEITKEDYRLYGNKELEQCAIHLNRFMKSHEEALEDNFIDLSSVAAEWKTLKVNLVYQPFRSSNTYADLISK